MWTGSVSPVMRQKDKGTRPARNLARRAARRHVLPGYPVEPRKMGLEEVRAYFSGDRIVCLRCGKAYSSLGNHLQSIHSMSDDDYREMYGLPWRRGLTSTVAKQNYSQKVLARIEAGWHPPLPFQSGSHQIKKRTARFQPFRAEQSRENIANAPVGGIRLSEDMFEKILQRVEQGRPVKQVLKDPDMPSRSWLHSHLKEKPEDRDRLMALLDTMPFEFQARNQMGFGPRFWSEVKRLRQQRLSDHQIGDQLGVAAMTINRRRREKGIA